MSKNPIVIAFFSDWGGESPLWSIDGWVFPDQLGLSGDLGQRLEAWANLFFENSTENGWTGTPDRAEYERSGRLLAEEVARVLGNEFQVEYHPLDFSSPKDAVIFRSRHEAIDPGTARAAYRRINGEDAIDPSSRR